MTTGNALFRITINGKDILRIRATRNDHYPELGYEDRKTWYLSDEIKGTSLGSVVGDEPRDIIAKIRERL